MTLCPDGLVSPIGCRDFFLQKYFAIFCNIQFIYLRIFCGIISKYKCVKEFEQLKISDVFRKIADACDSISEKLAEWKEKRSTQEKKKLSWEKKVLIAAGSVVGVLLILVAVAFGIFNHYYSKLNVETLDDDYQVIVTETDKDLEKLTDEQKAELEKHMDEKVDEGLKFDDRNVTNILLVGTDSREKGNRRSRSDTNIILSINRDTKEITMTSFMRDMYVQIPGAGKQRINAAFIFGGPQLLFNTFSTNFGIYLDKYAQVDFYSFMKVVDAVGGVDITVSSAELKSMNNAIAEINRHLGVDASNGKLKKSGTLHLNGKQALAYSRVRKVGNADFERTERQRRVLTEIFKKAKTMSVSELNDFADVVLPLISTNLTRTEVLSLVVNSPEYLKYDLKSQRVPIEGSYTYMTVNGASVLGVDFAANKKFWYKTVYGEE